MASSPTVVRSHVSYAPRSRICHVRSCKACAEGPIDSAFLNLARSDKTSAPQRVQHAVRRIFRRALVRRRPSVSDSVPRDWTCLGGFMGRLTLVGLALGCMLFACGGDDDKPSTGGGAGM